MSDLKHTKHNDQVFIEIRSYIKLITIKYVCPECNREDEVTTHSPHFCTADLVVSVIKKLVYLRERRCFNPGCRLKSKRGKSIEMGIKKIDCVLC